MKYLTLLIVVMGFACQTRQLPQDPIPTHDAFKLASTHVQETRVINVWTPSNYAKDKSDFPVLYMADGGIKEDFPHIANTLAALIRAGEIPPFILVGIENTDRRRDLTGFSEVADDAKYCPLTDGAKNFRAFIAEELIPEIDKKYRTTQVRGLIGESLSGLFVMETFFESPSLFDIYIAFDPSLWWNDSHLVRQANAKLEALPNKALRLWFAGSDAKDISTYTRQLAQKLTENKPPQLTWKYSDEPKEQHHTIFRATKEKALKWALNH